MHEDDEDKDESDPLSKLEQMVGQRHHRKTLDTTLRLLNHRVDVLLALCGHLLV